MLVLPHKQFFIGIFEKTTEPVYEEDQRTSLLLA
jgi:hypothetical protein